MLDAQPARHRAGGAGQRVAWHLAVAAARREAAVPRFVKTAEGEIETSALGVRLESLRCGHGDAAEPWTAPTSS
jgi:hypothetical protein